MITEELENLWYAVEYDDEFLEEIAGDELSELSDLQKEIIKYLVFWSVTYDFFLGYLEEK